MTTDTLFRRSGPVAVRLAKGSLCAGGIVFLALGACIVEAGSAGPWGLDQRPQNLTCVAPARPVVSSNVTAERVFANVSFADMGPVSMQQPPGDASRWFIAGRYGEIFSFANDQATTVKQLILDITDRMQYTDTSGSSVDSQQAGITSFALHPLFPVQPYLYAAYNAVPTVGADVNSVVSRFTSADGGQTFDSTSEEILLSIPQTLTKFHHLGQIVFGPDGYLHIGLGDGGRGVNSSDLNNLKGSILRIDVDNGLPYTVPADNPLVGTAFKSEIFAWGLRNPWRFTFDRETGDLWLGDVGASLWEEINVISSGGDYGWPVLEGHECSSAGCDPTPYEAPILVIEHPTARAVIGGYVYRGSDIPSLQGTYIFGDGVDTDTRGLFYDLMGQPYWDFVAASPNNRVPHSFAEDVSGEIYYVNFQRSEIIKLLQADPNPPPGDFPELLTQTGCVDIANPLSPAPGVIPYGVNSALWSDGAEKARWMAIPDGTTIGIMADGDFDFPAGTVLMKRFAFSGTPVETRLFIRHDDGIWAGYSYEWNNDLTDAVLLPAGKTKLISPGITWTYPSRNECLACHTSEANFALGPEIAQFNGSLTYPSTSTHANQLSTLDHIGLFSDGLPDQVQNLPALVPLSKIGAPTEWKARSYLHSNCSGCHRPGGSVQSPVDFRFSTPIESINACDLPPHLGDLGVPNARILKPGNPLLSIISLRMHSLGINRMPLLGSVVVDAEGTTAVDSWISQSDVCDMYPDSDGDLVRDNIDNCTQLSNTHQYDSNGDGFGNACDADFNDDLVINFADLIVMQDAFFANPTTSNWNADADLNGDDQINFIDLGLMSAAFFLAPGPSGIAP